MARRKLSSDINVVPYIDVMLVLLIIFMVTAPLLTQGVEVDLPKVEAQNMATTPDPVIVSVKANGDFYINRGEKTAEVVSDQQLRQRVETLVKAKPDELILVEGDGRAPYRDVAKAMAILQAAGATKVGFVTKPTDVRP